MDRSGYQPPQLAVIVSGFPRFSETFAINEILALHRRGMLGALVATKPGDGAPMQPGVAALMDVLHVLPQGAIHEQAAALVEHTAGRKIAAYHAYFAHLPLQVAVCAAKLQGLPYGFSTHARDARKIPKHELAELARGAACAVACNTDVAAELAAFGISVDLLPHGVDGQRFIPQPLGESHEFRLLAVGRFVPKKGFGNLLQAMAVMRNDCHLTLIGSGAGEPEVRQQIDTLGLTDRITLRGTITHEELPTAYAQADAVVVPSVVDDTGDRDGLPNVVLEAMACGRAIVASKVGAIESAIVSGVHGLLVESGNVSQLADALDELAVRPALRRQLGTNARRLIESAWNLPDCTQRFCRHLENCYV